MTDPRNTDPRQSGWHPRSDPSDRRSSGGMWGWIVGIAVVILAAFILAAVWNRAPETASKAPPATTGSGATTQAVPPPGTSGQNAGTPAMAPQKPAPSPAGTTK